MLEQIQELCRERSMTVTELEKALQFGHNTISRWDYVCPTVYRVQLVADYFGVTLDRILKGKRGEKNGN